MHNKLTILFTAFFMMISIFAFAEEANVKSDVTYLDQEGNPIDPSCIAFDENGAYVDESKCIKPADVNTKWHEGFMLRMNLGIFGGWQTLSTGYRFFEASTRGFSGELDFGYHWTYFGVFGTAHFKPGVATVNHKTSVTTSYVCDYYSCDEHEKVLAEYNAINKGDWNRSVGGFGAFVSIFLPVSTSSVISFDFGGRFLFGKATDDVHLHTEFNMFIGFNYQLLITDHFGLGLNIKIPGIISASTLKAFNQHIDIATRHVSESIFAEANFSMTYTF